MSVGSALGVSLFLVTWSSLPATLPNVFNFSILRIVSGDIKDLCYKCSVSVVLKNPFGRTAVSCHERSERWRSHPQGMKP
ncbi:MULTISPECIES: hypothetical protein [Nostoc]|uniref:Secreted protein n=2 Tax=Nostoc TaxID=1177 RepID=A0ABR8IJD2_9NOSO|nr:MULTISPECIES: hypothetical protein [Nostoc]MBD2566220.1 hypothetical protein [Nostoc linckia FACHB-391]MBD2650989.1 hypothetical protein [Nostoc foliaceum FACHB-393]